ncbi:MAG: hypothetical protein E7500_00960 [Ruminococcus sp.]|nr:hypothetical protein [Ruminococcus sp.]
MDSIIVTTLLVLGVIALIEAVSLFGSRYYEGTDAVGVLVIPVLPDDSGLYTKLENLSRKLSSGKLCTDEIILVNYGATQPQLEICRRFCYEHSNTVFTDPAGLEKILLKTFAIERET